MTESFEAARLREVHPGPVQITCGPSLVVIRAVEVYPHGTVVTWTCSPADGEVARLAQGTPRVSVRLADDEQTVYAPLGESLQGGGRTIFGTSFFDAAPPAALAAIAIEADVSGALGGGLVLSGRASFPLV